jgi:HSP20 family protein
MHYWDLDEDRLNGGDPQPVYRVPIDVLETARELVIVADVPGVDAESVRVMFTGGALVIAGEKRAPGCEAHKAAFHLAERTFGRFACAVRVSTPVDATRASALVRGGELRVTLPIVDDRRGREIEIDVKSAGV